MNMLYRNVRAGSEKARIWKICDELFAQTGRLPSGREVVDRYLTDGGNEGTGFTQYSHWKKAVQEQADVDAADMRPDDEAGSIAHRAMTVQTDGSITLPADLRRAMLLDADGRVTVSVVEGELRVISPMAAVRQLQRRASFLVAPGTLVSDELIAERRAEAAAHG